MSKKFHVRKGDQVMIITGQDKGRTGEIMRVDTKNERVYIKGLCMQKKHQKPTMTSPGGIVESERSIHVSNVMHVDPSTQKRTRIKRDRSTKSGLVRLAKVSGQAIPVSK